MRPKRLNLSPEERGLLLPEALTQGPGERTLLFSGSAHSGLPHHDWALLLNVSKGWQLQKNVRRFRPMTRGHVLKSFLTAPGLSCSPGTCFLDLKHHSQAVWPRIPVRAGWAELPIFGTKTVAPLEKAKEGGSWRKVPLSGRPKLRDLKARSWASVWGGSQAGRARRGGQQQGLRTHPL